MEADERLRLSWGERSGRYSSNGWRDEPEWHERGRRDENDPRQGDDRHREQRGGPERGQKRRSSDRSDDEYDGNYPDDHHEMEQNVASRTIMLRCLPLHITEDYIHSVLSQLEGPQPLEIRVITEGRGISRGLAFVDFERLEDSVRWMETNQNKLVIQGKRVMMCYSSRPSSEKWLCNVCGVFSYQKTLRCLRCGTAKPDSESPSAESQQRLDTLMFRNISPWSTVDGIVKMLAPYTQLSPDNIRLIKDKPSGKNRGYAFVQLSSSAEASRVLTALWKLRAPLELDSKCITVKYAKIARKELLPKPEVIRARDIPLGTKPKGWFPVAEDGLLGAGPETTPVVPVTTGVVISQASQLYQTAVQPHEIKRPVDAAQQTANAPEASTVATTACTAPTADMTAGPDTSTYKYDETTGFYCDPQTGLYYDPSSQYYYNSKTQQYLCWDSETQTYVPVATESDTEQASQEHRGKKPKKKSAHQIAKEMARWAKNVNKQKEILKCSYQDSGPSKEEEDWKESAAGDAGFSQFEQMEGFDMPPLMTEQFNISEYSSAQSSEYAGYDGDSDTEEGGSGRALYEEEKVTDWRRRLCLLCHRQFPTKEALLRHQHLSDLHKQNLEIHRRSKLTEDELEELERREIQLKYGDKAAERREKNGVSQTPAPMKRFYPPPTPTANYEQPTKDGLAGVNNEWAQAMSWEEDGGLGRHQQGITFPVSNLEIERRSELTEAELERREVEKQRYKDRAAQRRERHGDCGPLRQRKTQYPPPVNY